MSRESIGYRPTFTVAEFCDAHHISRSHLHKLIKDGKGPRLMKPGRRVLISAEAAADWRRDMERGDSWIEHLGEIA